MKYSVQLGNRVSLDFYERKVFTVNNAVLVDGLSLKERESKIDTRYYQIIHVLLYQCSECWII